VDWGLLFSTTITSFVFLIVGLLWWRFPPKKINFLYGYRTRRSMANQEIWEYANALGAKMFLYLGAVELIIGLGAYYLYPHHAPVIALFAMLIGIGMGMYWCETQLNKRFDKKGNQK
jgi:uncharacterized membrane protein